MPDPLHDYPLRGTQYWGCREPERVPVLTDENWDGRCRRCLIRMEFIRRQYGDLTVTHDVVFPRNSYTISDLIKKFVEMFWDEPPF